MAGVLRPGHRHQRAQLASYWDLHTKRADEPLHEAGIPTMYFQTTGDALTRDPQSTFTLVNPLPAVFGLPVAVAEGEDADKVAFVVIDVPVAVEAFESNGQDILENAGLDHELVRVPPGTADMTPQIQEVVDSGAEVVQVMGNDAFCIASFSWIEAPYDWAVYAQFSPELPRMPEWWPLNMTWGGLPAAVPPGYMGYFALPAVLGAALGRRLSERYDWRRPTTLLVTGFGVGITWAFLFNGFLGARLGVFHYGYVIEGRGPRSPKVSHELQSRTRRAARARVRTGAGPRLSAVSPTRPRSTSVTSSPSSAARSAA